MALTIEQRLTKARNEAKALKAERDMLAAQLAEATPPTEQMYATEAQQRLASALDSVLADFKTPTLARAVAGFVLAVAVAMGIGWLIGAVVNMAIMTALMLTGSSVLAWLIWLVGLICSAFAGMVTGSLAFDFVASGKVDSVYGAAKNKVAGFFKAKPSFTGLFTKEAA